MTALLDELGQMNELREAERALSDCDFPVLLTGVSAVHCSQLSAALAKKRQSPLLILCPDEKESLRMAADLRTLLRKDPILFPAGEWAIRSADTMSREWTHRRLRALWQIIEEDTPVVVATAVSAIQFCISRRMLRDHSLPLSVGQRYAIGDIARFLADAGYTRAEQVEGPGQFAVRGGILDVFSPDAENPVRCEFFDDELDSMGYFSIATQRRIENLTHTLFLPAGERLGGGQETLWDYLPERTLITVHEGVRVRDEVCRALTRLKESTSDGNDTPALTSLALSEELLLQHILGFQSIELDSFLSGQPFLAPKLLLQLHVKQLSTYGGSLDTACTDVAHYLSAGYRVLLLCGGEVRAKNMQQFLRERGIDAALEFSGQKMPEEKQVFIGLGTLSTGCEFSSLHLVILTEGQLTGKVSGKSERSRAAQKDGRQRLQSYTDLTPGDLVVHAHHGIGRFAGILRLPVDGVQRDYMKIDYAGTDCLYVPCTALDLVSKYIGSGEDSERSVKLHRLGGTEWAKTTYRAKAAAKELAEGLIKLYAQRQRLGGFAFSADSPWQQEFENSFDYEETTDQLRAVREIKADMERPVPMDRLLCGDVGYGKTEVALRAAMKCILDGKQAAFLVPTTVLAQQHYATALSRFHSFPVNIEVLSRFRSPKQVKEILQRLQEGRIDLLIGTHKLLQKNVIFKDLGLLIVDEEQRFGVKHKESLREKAQQVDTLTLSATPIPRTLNMALSGIRDMSAIEEPPRDRQVVQTYVLEHDLAVIVEAIRRELARGGQVYYLHNRVESIDSTAYRLKQLLGEDVVIATAHGKMSESQLSRVMQQMADGEIQILVCTTIIETGIDIPNVNTLIIEDADRMGLSQLHQIRGRIGRSPRRAYAYLTYRAGKVLSEVAVKRLTAIREYVEFGSGFQIAMRDLEIRGAGNLLGPEQSGYMMSVGYDMYLKLLNDAVLEQQGKSNRIRTECTADLAVSAHIPESYIPSAQQRMDLYRRIAAIRMQEDSADVLDEILDRYGEPPRAVKLLLDIALLRSMAADCGITDITQKGLEIVFSFSPQTDVPALISLCGMARYRRRLRLKAGGTPKLTYALLSSQDPLSAVREVAEELHLQHQYRENTGELPDREENK